MSEEVINDIFDEVDADYDENINYKTAISSADGGREYRYQQWLYPKRDFSLTLRARDRDEVNNIYNFYQRHAGTYDGFYFENPNESSSTSSVTDDVFATGDGSTANFYIGNKFSLPTGDCVIRAGSQTIQRSIGGTGDYSTLIETTDYTIDDSIGQVTPVITLPNNDVLRATYRFYYKVRFSEDNLKRSAFAYLLWNYGIDLIQVI